MTWHQRRPELRLSLEAEQTPRPEYVSELVSVIRALVRGGMKPGSAELGSLFHFMAHYVPDARLANGSRLCDATDFAEWLRELAREAEKG